VKADKIEAGNYRALMQDAMEAALPGMDPAAARKMAGLLSNGAQFTLRDRVVADPSLIGQTVTLTVPVSDPYDQLNKGLIDRATPEANRRLTDAEIALFRCAGGRGPDLQAGQLGLVGQRRFALSGTRRAERGTGGFFLALLTCFAFCRSRWASAPRSILRNSPPRTRVNDFIEININNLAAVPSVVFGLLALAVFLGWFGMPRSAPFVGGLTLALMTLPTIIIATRAASRPCPPRSARRRWALAPRASRWCFTTCCRWPCPAS
jgi:phosphate transport system permease protein